MSKRIEVPSDLEHLIEKRDAEADRRASIRRKARNSSTSSAGQPDRRKADRRKKTRRKSSS